MTVLKCPSAGRTVRLGWPLLAAALAVSVPAQSKPAQAAPPVKKLSLLAASVERATKRDQRILVLFGPRDAIVPIERAVNGIKVNGQRFGFEYTVIGAPTDGEGELSRQARVLKQSLSIGGRDTNDAVVAVLDARKRLVAQRPVSAFQKDGKTDGAAMSEFLDAHRVKLADAEEVWKDALAQAEASNKSLLLHLAAPW